jgi:ADP-ribosyl-[dinitrogen reductase] hydrolase
MRTTMKTSTHSRTPTRTDRLRGGLMGLLVGDALGVPFEFHGPENIPPQDQIEMVPPKGFPRAHRGTPPGTWSDDGAQALCLLASLLDREMFDAKDFAGRLLLWMTDGYMAVDARVFDIGITTSQALGRLDLDRPLEAGLTDERSCGNGSLMRVLPLALWHEVSDDELVRDAMAQSRITHAHPRVLACCAIYVVWARRMLDGVAPIEAWNSAVDAVLTCIPDVAVTTEVEGVAVATLDGRSIRGTGYVLDSLLAAKHLLETCGSYEEVVRGAVALGHDTDTTACIVGGLAGILYGVSGIPERWLLALRDPEVPQGLADRMLAAS